MEKALTKSGQRVAADIDFPIPGVDGPVDIYFVSKDFPNLISGGTGATNYWIDSYLDQGVVIEEITSTTKKVYFIPYTVILKIGDGRR